MQPDAETGINDDYDGDLVIYNDEYDGEYGGYGGGNDGDYDN